MSENPKMTTPFQQLLPIYRDNSETQREKGTYFEKLVIPFLQNDARFAQQFSKIKTFSEMAKKQHKSSLDSGIVNDANDWAIESMNNPCYPLELLQRVITVSLETVNIVNNLPKLF